MKTIFDSSDGISKDKAEINWEKMIDNKDSEIINSNDDGNSLFQLKTTSG